MDTLRDKNLLEELWQSGQAPWKTLVSDARRTCRRRRSGAASASCSPATPASRAPGSRSGCAGSAPRSPGSRWPPTSRPACSSWLDVETTIASTHRRPARRRARCAAAVRAARPRGRLPPRRAGAGARELPRAARDLRDQRDGHGAPARRAARRRPTLRVAVVVTTDKVYRNREWAYPYREGDALGGHDPYSASKAAAELVAASYRERLPRRRRASRVATARAGNVIGGGDWCEDRLIPDAVRAWSSGRGAAGAPPGRDPALAARARSARRLPAPGREAVATRRRSPTPTTSARAPTRRRASARCSRWRARPTAAASGIADAEEGGPHEAGRLALEVARARARARRGAALEPARSGRADDALVPAPARRRVGARAVRGRHRRP